MKIKLQTVAPAMTEEAKIERLVMLSLVADPLRGTSPEVQYPKIKSSADVAEVVK